MSRDRAQHWGANDTIEDGYLENSVADKRGYESDPTENPDLSLHRAPLSNLSIQGGIWFRKTVNRWEGEPYFKPLGGKPLSDATHTDGLDGNRPIDKL